MELMHGLKPIPPSLPGLISHIQTVTEREKAVIARELHDELGGMLVAASMDLSWLEQHIKAPGGGDVGRPSTSSGRSSRSCVRRFWITSACSPRFVGWSAAVVPGLRFLARFNFRTRSPTSLPTQ